MSNSLLPHGPHGSVIGFPVLHYLPEFAQTHVRLADVAIQPSHLSPFSCVQSFQASGSFLMSQLFTSGGQSISLSFSISPSNEYSGLISFTIDWFNLLAVQGILRVFSSTTIQSINSSVLSLLYGPALTFIHDYWKNHSFDYKDLCWQSNVSTF